MILFLKKYLNETFIFIILTTCYVYFFPRWADPNQNSRLDMVVAIVDDQSFQIDKYVSNTVDYAKVGDHYYSDKAPGVALLGVPIYYGLKTFLNLPVMQQAVAKLSSNQAFLATLNPEGTGIFEQKLRFAIAQVIITFLISALPTALLGILIYRSLLLFTDNPKSRLFVVFVYGLLTPAFVYANAFYGHQLSAVLLFIAFYFIFIQNRLFSIPKAIFLGFCLAYSVITEYPAFLVTILLFSVAAWRLLRSKQIKALALVTVTAGILAVLWMGYNTKIFGGPLSFGYSQSELWQTQHHTGFMSLTFPHWDAFYGITFSAFRGLFYFSPILLLSFVGFYFWWKTKRHRDIWLLSLSSVTLIFIFNMSSSMWWGGYAVGPRYLLPMIPFLVLPLVFVFEKWLSNLWFKIISLVLILWSLVTTWGLALAGQGYAPDTFKNPLVEYALPNWLEGNIARNIGTVIGISGGLSLLLLVAILSIEAIAWFVINKRLAKSRKEILFV